MRNGNSKVRQLVISLIVFHTLFAAIILLRMPEWNEFYAGRLDFILREVSLNYGFFLLPFAIWHASDALQSISFSNGILALLQAYLFALPFFVALIVWDLAYALDIVDVPGAHEVGTLNAYGTVITLALVAIVVLVALAKLIIAILSRFCARRANRRVEQ